MYGKKRDTLKLSKVSPNILKFSQKKCSIFHFSSYCHVEEALRMKPMP